MHLCWQVMLSVIQVDFQIQRVVTDDGACLRLLLWDEPETLVVTAPLRFRQKHLSSMPGSVCGGEIWGNFKDLKRIGLCCAPIKRRVQQPKHTEHMTLITGSLFIIGIIGPLFPAMAWDPLWTNYCILGDVLELASRFPGKHFVAERSDVLDDVKWPQMTPNWSFFHDVNGMVYWGWPLRHWNNMAVGISAYFCMFNA